MHTFVAKITISAHPNFVHFLGLLYISEKICTFHFLSRNRNRSPALSILCTAIQHGKMPQVGIGTKILECLYSLKVRWQRPLSVPFLFCTSGKGTDKITSFTCALIGLHHCWVWQPCEVMTFCKHLDDTRKSDSFNQVNELKMIDAVDLDFRKLYFAASFMLESAEGEGEEEGQHWSPEFVTGMQQQL